MPALFAALSSMLAAPAPAATWEVVRALTLDETYTDNVRLSPEGAERSDWVTTLTPSLAVRARGDRLRFDFTYSPHLVYRATEGSNDVVHLLDALGTAELVKRALFLDVRSRISEENISIRGTQTDTSVNLTDNRTSVRSFLVSPYFRHDFASDARAEARLTYSVLGTDAEADAARSSLLDSRANGIDLQVVSGPAFRLLTWNAAYTKQHIDYREAGTQDVDLEKITAGARRLVTPQVGIVANAGYEDNSFRTFGSSPKGALWNVGFDWVPSPRTRLLVTAGRNWQGATGLLDFSHCTRLSIWTLSYSHDVTTARSQAFVSSPVATADRIDGLFRCTVPDPVARAAAVTEFIEQNVPPPSFGIPFGFNTSVPYLLKRLQASTAIRGVRNTLLANVYAQTREALGPIDQPGAGDFADSERIKERGASVLWTSRLSRTTTSNLGTGVTRVEFTETGIADTQKFIRASVVHHFLPRIVGSLSLRRLWHDSTDGRARYTENAASVAVTLSF